MFQRIVDSFTGPMISILTAARDHLNSVSLVAARGLNLDYFLGPIAQLGPAWTAMISSLIAASFLLLSVLTARKLYDIYISFKEGVQWW